MNRIRRFKRSPFQCTLVFLLVSVCAGFAFPQAYWTISPTSQIGGWRNDVAIEGDIAGLAEGLSVSLYDISGDAPAKLSALNLPVEPTIIIMHDGMLYGVSGRHWEPGLFIAADVSDPLNPLLIGQCEGESYAGSMALHGNHVYFSIAEFGTPIDIGVVDISDPTDPVAQGHLDLGVNVVISAFTIDGGLLYAQGRRGGTRTFFVYSLANPLAPVLLGELDLGTAEISDGLHASGDRVYSAIRDAGVRVLDVSDPAEPAARALFEVRTEGMPRRANDLYVDGNLLYVASGDGVLVYDVGNVDDPVQLGVILPMAGMQRIDGSTGGVVALSSGNLALHVVKMDDGEPVFAGSGFSPVQTGAILADGDMLYMGEQIPYGGATLWIYDVANPADPLYVTRTLDWRKFQPAALQGSHLIGTFDSSYFSSYPNAFAILDVSDPQAIAEVSQLNAGMILRRAVISGTRAYLLGQDGGGTGAVVVDFSDPQDPFLAGTLPFPSIEKIGWWDEPQQDIAVSGNIVAIAGETAAGLRVHILDATNPVSPVLKAALTPTGDSISLWMEGTTLLVLSNVGSTSHLEIFDLSDPADPQPAGSLETEPGGRDITVLDGDEGELILLIAKPQGSVHTYGYNTETQEITEGPVCPSPYSHRVAVSRTPNSSGSYTVVTSDESYGTFIQEILKDPLTCCLTTSVMPEEAAADGCTASPVRMEPVECGSMIGVSATAVEPWVFVEWTGAASGTSPMTQAHVTESCSHATAIFARPELVLGAGGLNPHDGTEFYGIAGPYSYHSGATDVPIIHITLTANEVDDWEVTALSFQSSGSGNERLDVEEVRLYLGDIGGALLGTGVYNADNGGITFSFNQMIPAGQTRSFVMVYDFKPERAWPCNSYSANISMNGVAAEPVNYPPGVKLPPDEPVIGGPSHVKRGTLVKQEGSDNQYGQAEDPEADNEPLENPLKVRLAWQHPESVHFIRYEIVSPSAHGGFLDGVPGTRHTEKQVDEQGYAEAELTLGVRRGSQNPYDVELSMETKGAACIGSWARPQFRAWGMGLDLEVESRYDNPAKVDYFGTFLSDIEAENTFTVHLDMAPEDFAEVQEVLFTMGGQTETGREVVQNKEYEADFDMAAFDQPQKLGITVVLLKDGSTVEQTAEVDVKSIRLPTWVNVVQAIAHPDSFSMEFDGDGNGEYQFEFAYPTDFAWSDLVPGDVGMLGGLDNDLDFEFLAHALYRIDETSTFGAGVSGEPVLLGFEFSIEGGLSGDFDENFAFQRGSGHLRAGFGFDLPKKGHSKTIFVYGVPLTIAVDLSGNVEIFVRGSAVLNRELEFERISVAPGTTVSGDITISLSAVFGLAKLAATGSPTATIEIELTYITNAGTQDTWYGEVSVPISVVGSIFWGMGSAELYSGELGPWTFGSAAGDPVAASPMGMPPEGTAPAFISASALAIDSEGRRMHVWTADTGHDPTPNPDVFFRIYDESWSIAEPIIGAANSPDEFWETDPAVVFMGGGHALAAWTSNKGEKTLDNLWDILAHQEIAYSVWDGHDWTAPGLLTNDDKADGVVSLAYDATLDQIMAVWVHDTVDHKQGGLHDGTIVRTGWKLLYALYSQGAWTIPADVAETANGTADFMPAVAADGNGNVFLVWARDDDGIFFTQKGFTQAGSDIDPANQDSHIYWSRWLGAAWSAPEPLTESNDDTALFPALAFAANGDAVAVWVEKAADHDRLVYRVYRSGSWGARGMIHQSPLPIDQPGVAIAPDGTVTVVWQGHLKGRSNLFMNRAMVGALGETYEWADPSPVTNDGHVDWNVSVTIEPDGSPVMSWTKFDPAEGDAAAGGGLGDGVHFGSPAPGTAEFTGTVTVETVDENSDGLYDYLRFHVEVVVTAPGTYRIEADLIGPWKLMTVYSPDYELGVGTHTLALEVPGGVLSDISYDGPYTLDRITLMELTDSHLVAAFRHEPYVSASLYASEFTSGSLMLDKSAYRGLQDLASVQLEAPGANLDPSVIEQVAVRVTGTMDPKGIVLMLTETGPDTSIFSGSFGFSTSASSQAEKQIQVIDHSRVEVLYNDPHLGYDWIASSLWTDHSGIPQILITDATFGMDEHGFGLPITGQGGMQVVVEATPDLRSGEWIPVGTNLLLDGAWIFRDSSATNLPHRFYRVRGE